MSPRLTRTHHPLLFNLMCSPSFCSSLVLSGTHPPSSFSALMCCFCLFWSGPSGTQRNRFFDTTTANNFLSFLQIIPFFLLRNLLTSCSSYKDSCFPIRNPLILAKNPVSFWIFLLRSCFLPFSLLGFWHFSIFLVGKLRIGSYLPPHTFPDKFLDRILVRFHLIWPGSKQELVKNFGIRFNRLTLNLKV